MSKKIRIKFIVPINCADYNEIFVKHLEPILAPDVEIDVENITGGSASIESRYDLNNNAPHVMDLAIKAEKDGFHGVCVSDIDMCGVDIAREVVAIPVIGGFRSNAFTAMLLSQKFSIITFLNNVANMQSSHVKRFGVMDNFASIRSIQLPVHELHGPKVFDKVLEQSIKAIEEDGAQSIMFGCTGFIEFADRLADALGKYLDDKFTRDKTINLEKNRRVPVIDPNRVMVCYMELLIRNNLSQGRLTYYTSRNYHKPTP